MTEQERLHIRAELAQRMGYSQRHTTHLLAAELAGDWLKSDGSFFDDAPPDPFTDAADNRALVAWMATDDERWERFLDEFQITAGWKYWLWQPTLIKVIMTASLDTITLAAAKALGIPEVGERA